MGILMISCKAFGDGDVECPADCSCKTLASYVNSREVKCSYLDMSDVPVILDFATVHTLDLSNNRITILRNATFSNYSRLSTVTLSYNEVSDIEQKAFAGLQMLTDIDLSYNNLISVNPEIFSSNPALKNVSLKGNRIVYLSSGSPILISSSISSLDLSSCSLTEIYPTTFSRLPNLTVLDLSCNLLQTISVHTLEKVPDLKILKLNSNRFTCNCDVVEVMELTKTRTERQRPHKPISCLEGGEYRTLWTVAGGNRSCSESNATDPPVGSEFTTDMTTEISTVSVDFPPPVRPLPYTFQREGETEEKNGSEQRPAQDSETEGWSSLLSWNDNTLMVFVILPLTLGAAVFVSLIAVRYFTKRCKVRRRHGVEGNDNHLALFFSYVPLQDRQLTADPKKQPAGHLNRSSGGVPGTECHVYEQIS